MVAYSFKERFIIPIAIGLRMNPAGLVEVTGGTAYTDVTPKRQTIRAIGRRRHARPGEQLQLYTAMRTKQCRLIGRARCARTRQIRLDFALGEVGLTDLALASSEIIVSPERLDAFARRDGFRDWAEMKRFWRHEHDEVRRFQGILVEWEPL